MYFIYVRLQANFKNSRRSVHNKFKSFNHSTFKNNNIISAFDHGITSFGESLITNVLDQ